MTKIAMALAAASMLAAPAAVAQNGNAYAYGQGPRVCLITFNDGVGTQASDVLKAQYLPLGVALKQKARVSGDFQSINTYGSTGATGAGIDAARVDPQAFDVANTLTNANTTEEVCNFLADLAEENYGDDDSDD